MFTNAEISQQLINEKRNDFIAEAEQYRLLATARKALRGRRAKARRTESLS
jgi:hypothetical protein